ncbi:hypothetical protein AAG906_034043 [Vitis piasezkii]
MHQLTPEPVKKWRKSCATDSIDLSKKMESELKEWEGCGDHIIQGDSHADESRYMEWYSSITHKCIGRPSPVPHPTAQESPYSMLYPTTQQKSSSLPKLTIQQTPSPLPNPVTQQISSPLAPTTPQQKSSPVSSSTTQQMPLPLASYPHNLIMAISSTWLNHSTKIPLVWPLNGILTQNWIQDVMSALSGHPGISLAQNSPPSCPHDAGFPSQKLIFVFNGDYIGVGWGLETLLLLLEAYIVLKPPTFDDLVFHTFEAATPGAKGVCSIKAMNSQICCQQDERNKESLAGEEKSIYSEICHQQNGRNKEGLADEKKEQRNRRRKESQVREIAGCCQFDDIVILAEGAAGHSVWRWAKNIRIFLSLHPKTTEACVCCD